MQRYRSRCSRDRVRIAFLRLALLALLEPSLHVDSFPIFTSSVSRSAKPRPFSGAIYTEKRPSRPIATPQFVPPTANTIIQKQDISKAIITLFNANGIKSLAGKRWDLNKCPPGISISVGGKVLTKKSFYCTKHDAMKLAPMLNGEDLTERAYVWCRTAFLFNSLSSQAKSFNVDDLDHFEEDIILRRENVDLVLSSYFPNALLREASRGAAHDYQQRITGRRQKRKITKLGYQWPNGRIPFSMNDPDFTERDKNVIIEGISEWEKHTCVRFMETPYRRNRPHVLFMKGTSGCSSTVGRLRYGQLIYLGEGCIYLGTVCHEIGHTLGFYHEQARPDRDHYVVVENQNIENKYHGQFLKSHWNSVYTHGIPYDYSSVMHYGAVAFSKNDKPTLRTKDPEMQMVIGQREKISFYDLKLANTNYCERSCGTLTLESERCKNGGYLNPNNCNACLCPSGLAPPFCDNPLPGKNVDCGAQLLTASSGTRTLFSPGYSGAGFPGNSSCSYIIKTSAQGRQIKLQFRGPFSFTDDAVRCYDYVEIRHKQIITPGPRFCGRKKPGKQLVSHGAEVMVLVDTGDSRSWQGFQLEYYEERCGGCSSDSVNGETPCSKVVRFICAPSGIDNYCMRDETYCCSGFRLVQGRCTREVQTVATTTTTTTSTTPRRRTTQRQTTRRQTTRRANFRTRWPVFTAFRPVKTTRRPPVDPWGPWGGWSACSVTCGMCGQRQRTRRCRIPSRCGSSVQRDVQTCGQSVCPFETVTRSKICRRIKSSRCSWFQVSCYVSYTCYELTTKPRCCVGTPINGRCWR